MQSWIPAQGRGVGVSWALPIVLATMVHSQVVLGTGGSLVVVPFEATSTLDGHVPQQDWESQKTVLDVVDSGILLGRKPPQFRAPKPTGPALNGPAPNETISNETIPKHANKATDLPRLSQPTLLAPTDKRPSVDPPAADVVARVSPFRKWVKPQRASADRSETDVAAPQVARRSATKQRVRPIPLPDRHSDTAVASDHSQENLKLPDRSREQPAQEKKARSIPERGQRQSPPTSYPDPKSGSASESSPAVKLPPLTRSQQNLRHKIRRVLTHYYNRPLNTRDRSPWELMHAMLAFEAHSKVLQGGPNGEPITAVGWLCFNQACKRRTLMYVSDDNELRVRVGPALQGHRGQLLALLAQSRINENYPMLVEGHELKVADLIEMEKRTCYPRTELTFKLIGLMHYLDSDATWLNDQGLEWSIPKLIAEEIRQPVRSAACGGTHRLSGLTLAFKTREKRGEPVEGEYLKAKKFVTRYQQYAYRMQNRDGSFSTEWFRGPGNEEDLDRKLKTTGHILEWLLYAATETELKHWRTTKAANYLANSMYNNRYKDWEAGPLGHAVHALLVYDRLVFSPYDPPNHSPIANQPVASRQERRNR